MNVHERFKAERERLGLTQPRVAALTGVGKTTVINWEKGSSSPTAVQLSALADFGLDVLYVVTGQFSGGVQPAPTLSEDERLLLHYYREAEPAVRKAALGALLGVVDRGVQIGGAFSQHATGDGSIQIGRVKKAKD